MADTKIEKPRDFPSVEELLQSKRLSAAVSSVPRPVAAGVVKSVVARSKAQLGKSSRATTLTALQGEIESEIRKVKRTEITRVINASGIVVHTNLGRAPLSEALFEAIKKTVVGYGNIEFDLATGSRGRRGLACEQYLATLSGAESGTVVNNCAAALFIILNSLANRRKVAISRGELVQIGGGFRIPDILKRAGARLTEIGTTNITTAKDYESAITDGAALILKVHKSNFVQGGFTEEAPLNQLVPLSHKHDVPLVNDLGSGVFVPTKAVLGYAEPTVQQSVRAGTDLTCFSGDKLLGGMQAGLIVGRADLITKIKKNPIFRTVRVDKVVFSVLEKLLQIYLDGTHLTDIKLWSVLSTTRKELENRARNILKAAGNPSGIKAQSTSGYVGGGALPEAKIPSVGLVFSKKYKPTLLMKKFRELEPPVIGRIADDVFILDMKTVDEGDLVPLGKSIKRVLDGIGRKGA
jgi:L-seryl-tRNA(Ser) seleniumtransferase